MSDRDRTTRRRRFEPMTEKLDKRDVPGILATTTIMGGINSGSIAGVVPSAISGHAVGHYEVEPESDPGEFPGDKLEAPKPTPMPLPMTSSATGAIIGTNPTARIVVGAPIGGLVTPTVKPVYNPDPTVVPDQPATFPWQTMPAFKYPIN